MEISRENNFDEMESVENHLLLLLVNVHHPVQERPAQHESEELIHQSAGDDGRSRQEKLIPRHQARLEDEEHYGEREGGDEVEDETLKTEIRRWVGRQEKSRELGRQIFQVAISTRWK